MIELYLIGIIFFLFLLSAIKFSDPSDIAIYSAFWPLFLIYAIVLIIALAWQRYIDREGSER